MEARCIRVRGTARFAMPADLVIDRPVRDLDLDTGDMLRVEPTAGPMEAGRWYLLSFGSSHDVLVEASAHAGGIVFREEDAPADDLRTYLPDKHRVSFEVTHGVRRIAGR